MLRPPSPAPGLTLYPPVLPVLVSWSLLSPGYVLCEAGQCLPCPSLRPWCLAQPQACSDRGVTVMAVLRLCYGAWG